MSRSKKVLLASAAAIVVLVIAAVTAFFPPAWRAVADARAAKACDRVEEGKRIDCLLQIPLQYVRAGELPSAFSAFKKIYEKYPQFGAAGCHVLAHRLGDAAYYEFFLARGLSLEQMHIPQAATTCGYGFFHGFIEHLIQDHPQEMYVRKTCEYLRATYASSMRDIATICYHASGHGFIQAVADTLSRKKPSDIAVITRVPLSKCESVEGISEREREDCREGVFNVVSDWMVTKDFGLQFSYERPFSECLALPQEWHWACYYEFGQKLEPVVRDSPIKAAHFVMSIAKEDIREMTLGVMIAGMMERQAPLNGYERIFRECTEIANDGLFNTCIRSAATGMMEHGNPGSEYEKPLAVCGQSFLEVRGGTAICYKALGQRLSRFYERDKKNAVCALFPSTYVQECRSYD